MNYDIVYFTGIKVAGLQARTGNSEPDVMQKISDLWRRLMTDGEITEIPERTGRVYGVYHGYESDVNGQYDVLAGAEVSGASKLPDKFAVVAIPAGNYAKFSFHGIQADQVAKFWQEVWGTPLDRAYTFDFEEYLPSGDEINIYISLK